MFAWQFGGSSVGGIFFTLWNEVLDCLTMALFSGLYSPKAPCFMHVKRMEARGEDEEIGFERMDVSNEFEARFQLPRRLAPTAATMVDLYLPD